MPDDTVDITLHTVPASDSIEDPTLEELESPFLKNIAEDLSKESLVKIGRVVVDDYNSDLLSRSGLEGRIKEWHKLFVGLKESKDIPWPNCANVKLPILATACLQYHARAVDTILTPKNIAKCWATDGKAVGQAERCENYINWQLTDQMDEWVPDTDTLLLIQPLYGGAVKKTYYDPTLERVVSKTLRIDEFVAPYGVKRLDDAPRKTHVQQFHLNDIRIKGANKTWINLDGVKDSEGSDVIEIPGQEHRQSVDKNTGVEPSAESADRPRTILEQHRTWDLNNDGVEEWYAITVDFETEQVLRIESLMYEDPMDKKIKKFEYFTAYSFIPNPDSWMGLGYGHLLEHLNVTANSVTNQLLDSGTLSNNISGLFDQRSGLEDGDVAFTMGQFNGVNASTDDINKAVHVFKFNPPSNTLFALKQDIENHAKELASVSDTMLGKAPPSDTTATTMLAILEQGLKLNSTINQRTHRSMRSEFKKIQLLNSFYIDEDKYFMVQDSQGSEMVQGFLGKDDFKNSIDVIPVSDPNITSKAEKLIKARSAYELLRQDPTIANDTEAVYRLQYNLLDALEVQNIDQLLPKPEPQEPPDLRPEQEESEFLAERNVLPLPHQDHGAHLKSHRAFQGSDFSQQLTQQGKKLLEGHIRETVAMFYLQLKQSEEAVRNEQTFAGRDEGLGEEPFNAGIPSGTETGGVVPNGGLGPEG